ncbi:MAG TPA: 50S ribosomal protein L29 [Patescibacteria group bacterium]|nr:50S ribosomal protein L29 [Patescibacteria group bacterium]
MEFSELKKKSEKDLQKLLKQLREDVRALRFSLAAGQEKDVSKPKKMKKQIAQILTLLANKKDE